MVVDRPVPANFLFTKPQHFIALGFGAGLLPGAPGTVGAAIGVGVYWGLAHLTVAWQVGVLAFLFLAGCYICAVTARGLGVHDHGAIVWDEIWGMAFTLSIVPVEPKNWLAAFVLFRFFDIWKPWPIDYLDRKVQGGLGIMIDDFVAAGYAALMVVAFNYIIN